MKNFKKVMFGTVLLFSMYVFTGCIGIAVGDLKSDDPSQKDFKKPAVTTVNHYHYIILLDKQDLQYRHKKHPGEAGNNYQSLPYENADHRKQRGRTAPNRALKNTPEVSEIQAQPKD